MCAPLAVTALTAVSGAMSAYGQYQQGKATNSYYQYLAGQSRVEGQTAYDRSIKQSEMVQDSAKEQEKIRAIKAAELGGEQKTAMAASGIDTSSVTAQDITLSTLTKGKMDEMMIRRNADLNSWEALEQGKLAKWQGEEQAKQYGFAGKQAKRAGKIGAFTSLLGTAAQTGLTGFNTGLFK